MLRGLFILLTGACAVASFLYYSKKSFPGTVIVRYLLVFLRTLLLSGIFFLIFFRVISFESEKSEKPLLAVVIDGSQSADEALPAESAAYYADSLLHTESFRILAHKSNVLFCAFGGDAVFSKNFQPVLPPALISSTNISNALEKTAQKLSPSRPDACILITDGNYNRGSNPIHTARKLGCPVHVISAGADSVPADVEVSDMRTNEITFARTNLSVEADITARGYAGRKVRVFLRAGERIADSKTIVLPNEGQVETVTLSCSSRGAGPYPLSIEVPPMSEEIYSDNNKRDMTITVLKEKIKVLLVSGFPDPDTGALYRTLSRDNTTDVYHRVLSKQEDFNGGSAVPDKADEYDVLICKELFSNDVFYKHSKFIRDLTENYAGNMLIVQHRTPVEYFSQLFSVSLTGSRLRSVTVSRTASALQHPVFTDLSDDIIPALPPLTLAYKSVDFSVPADVLLMGAAVEDRENQCPVVSASSFMNRKRMYIWGAGLYAWALNRDSGSWFEGFVSNSVRWLSMRDQAGRRRVILRTNRKNFESGQQVAVSVQVYGELYASLQGSSVEVQVLKRGEEYTRFLCESRGHGVFTGRTVLHESGNYTFIARGIAEGSYAGSDTAAVYVSSFNPEYHMSGANMQILRSVAQATGGQLARAHEPLDEFFENIIMRPVLRNVQVITDLLTVPYILAGIVLLAAAEWALRKRIGLL